MRNKGFLKFVGVVVATSILAACGGGGASFGGTTGSTTGTTTGGTTGTTTPQVPATITLVTSSPQLLSSATTSTQGVTLTAIVLDATNNVIPNATVKFSAARDAVSSCGQGGALEVLNSGLTNASGQAQAILYAVDPTNQTIDITATIGSVSSPVLQVVETGTKLTINGPSAVGLNGTASYTIALVDAGNNPISSQAITITSAKSNSVALSSTKTGTNGQLTVTYSATNAGADTLTAQPTGCTSAVNTTATSIQVATQNLAVVAPNPNSQIPFGATGTLSIGATVASGGTGYVVGDVLTVPGGTSTIPAKLTVASIATGGAITAVNVTNAGTYSSIPLGTVAVTGGSGTGATFTIVQNITVQLTGGTVSGKTITFNTTRGTLSTTSAPTNASGLATVSITQATGAGNAGGALITATCTNCSPQISTSVSVQFNATVAASVALQANPSNVAISGTSAITAAVRDPNGNPAANQLVQFTLVDNSGGGLKQSSATTDSSGQATITYQAGGSSSSANGVTVTGAIGSVTGSTNLTVGGLALRVVLGTGNTIAAPNSTQYQLPYSVLVTDSAGNPPPAGSAVSLVANAVAYQKGHWIKGATAWVQVKEVDCTSDLGCASTNAYGCYNEDKDLNGSLNVPPDVDYNNDSKLEPGNVTSVPVNVPLDSTGTGQFNVTYPKDRAFWVQVFITATITVNGNQGTTTAVFELPGLSSDYSNLNVAPPGIVSPYGDNPSGVGLGSDVCLNPPPN